MPVSREEEEAVISLLAGEDDHDGSTSDSTYSTSSTSSSSVRDEKKDYPTIAAAYEISKIAQILKTSILRILLVLIPSFLKRRPPAPPASPSTPSPMLHPTAYLDGLRGTAAFFVFLHHSIIDWYPSLSQGYGSGDAMTTSALLQLPVVRIVYAGRGMVAVFFIISGYVLSYRALRLAHERQFASVLETLASSVFRRGMRLYLPTVVSTFVSALFAWAGWYTKVGGNVVPPVAESLTAQIRDWCGHTLSLVNPFQLVDGRNLFSPVYDGHLWTIPIEFHGSMIVFLTLLGLCKARAIIRLGLLAALVVYTLWIGQWHLFLFLCGSLFCDIHFFHRSRMNSSIGQASSQMTIIPDSSRRRLVQAISFILFALSLWILCFPDERAESSPCYITMMAYTPNLYAALGIVQRFWLSIGAFFLFFSLTLSPLLQSIFSSPIPQYLGKISFALYIVHGPVLYTLGTDMLIPAMTFKEDTWKYATMFVGAMAINTVACFLAADLFWREVDVRSVALASWIQRRCWVKNE